MKSSLFYLLQMIIASGVLYGYYHLFLREKKFHQYNRFYLLCATIISIIIPFINIPVYYSQAADHSSFIYQTLSVISTHDTESIRVDSNTIRNQSVFFTWQLLILIFYTLIGCFILTRFSIALYKIKYLIKTYPAKKLENIHLIETSEPGTPFSFFKWLFWNNKIRLNSTEGEQIFRHELFHIQQKHSWDIVFMELITVLFWINPFYHLIKKEIKAIHEFLADEFAMKDSQNWNYAELLLMQALGTQNNRLTNPFFHNQIKRRISMITSSKHPTYQYLRKVMVLPIAAILFVLLAFQIQHKENKFTDLKTQIPITVVIDPGHGGKDPGVSLNGINEKDICLAIAKKIKAMNKDENIHLIFTRLGDSSTSPKEDADFADKNKADILISLHVNVADLSKKDESKKGIEVYVSSRKKEDYKSGVLATALINELQNTYDINRFVLKKETGIWILDAPKCAAALIEFGYITNPEDFKFITDEVNQEKIATDILRAIQKYVSVRVQGVSEENTPLKFETEKNTGRNIVTYNGYEVNQWDTIPINSKIRSEDIKEISVRGGLIVIKLKNGDSILAVQNEFLERERVKQNEMVRLLKLNQSAGAENEWKKMMEARQRETQHQNEEFEKILEVKKEEFKNRQEEFQKMLEMKQDGIPKEKQEEFQKMLEMKQKEVKIQEEEFRKMLEMKQKEAKIQEEEFKKILESKERESTKQEEEFYEMLEKQQREAMMQVEEYRKMMELKQHEGEKKNLKKVQQKSKNKK